ncbi:MAG: sulfite exporter TauE/SafE family protein, partial [Pseudomonadota bacterium]
MEWWLIYLLTGAFVGFFAGLLGIGGGLIIVPMLITAFTIQEFPADRIIHLALGTTMATIIFTSAASLRTHHQHGAVDWQIVKNITPGIFLGTFGGATLAGSMTGQLLSIIFVIFIFYAATQMLLQFRPSPMFQLPGKTGMLLAGGVIGALSSLVAIGGGLLSVPFLT